MMALAPVLALQSNAGAGASLSVNGSTDQGLIRDRPLIRKTRSRCDQWGRKALGRAMEEHAMQRNGHARLETRHSSAKEHTRHTKMSKLDLQLLGIAAR